MTQALYAHMNNKTIKLKIKKNLGSLFFSIDLSIPLPRPPSPDNFTFISIETG
jgi:hypothetical protein